MIKQEILDSLEELSDVEQHQVLGYIQSLLDRAKSAHSLSKPHSIPIADLEQMEQHIEKAFGKPEHNQDVTLD